MSDFMAVEYNALTDETIERVMTKKEITELKLVLDEVKAQNEQEIGKAAARKSALAKLAELGLTAEEIAAL